MQDFIGKPISEVRNLDEILDEKLERKSFIEGVKVSRRLEFECLISVLDFYAVVVTSMGYRQANRIGTY